MFSCLNLRRTSPIVQPSSTIGDSVIIPGCPFCHVTKENGFDIVYEDDSFLMFKDRSPAALHHLLLVPREHIESVRSLGKSDVEMVKSMEEIGHKVLDGLDIPTARRRLGFHIPPFNSVNHLHLHVQALPYKSYAKSLKYPIAEGKLGYSKGYSWFVTAEQTVKILEGGGAVKISPC